MSAAGASLLDGFSVRDDEDEDDAVAMALEAQQREIAYRPWAVRNETELLLQLQLPGASQTRLVKPGGLLSFGEADGAHIDVAKEKPAETMPCEALTQAAKSGDLSLAAELLHRFASPDSIDSKGRGALHRAAKHKKTEMVALLLRHCLAPVLVPAPVPAPVPVRASTPTPGADMSL